ncbi:MAG: DUF3050 domain-containing protein [Flavobacteriales bacterium]
MHNNALSEKIAQTRSELIQHPLYTQIRSAEDMRTFMEHHVFAVWDFMCLLKTLQSGLTCTSSPWVPVGKASTRFLINEIVVGEESDLDDEGQRLSHFEIYLKAMEKAGCNMQPIQNFIELIMKGVHVETALIESKAPSASAAFVRSTFEAIQSNKLHVVSAVFTYGREDLIPEMFHAIVEQLRANSPQEWSTFLYYLDRHIEVDGGHHGQLALQMNEELIGGDELKRKESQEFTINALKARISLWDGVLQAIHSPVNSY